MPAHPAWLSCVGLFFGGAAAEYSRLKKLVPSRLNFGLPINTQWL